MNPIIIRAFTLYLGSRWKGPFINEFDLGLLLFRLFKSGQLGQVRVPDIDTSYPRGTDYKRLVRDLVDIGILVPNRNVRGWRVFNVLGKKGSPEELICAIDPFAYVSHLSAMAYHGVTDRFPRTIFYSTPARKTWHQFANDKQKKVLDDSFQNYIESRLPRLARRTVSKIDRYSVVMYSSIHLGAFVQVADKMLRVSSLGRTFLDMLREPKYCGGIRHVLQVFAEYAEEYNRAITTEIDRHGSSIEKVRAGYILDERLGIQNETIGNWLELAQRGGSRKLDPNAEYDGLNISEKWCLSVNI